MIFRQLDANGDWTFGKGQANYATDESAIDLNLRTRILSWIGNCFFALDEGVDWSNRLDKGQTENLKNELRNLIIQSFGIVGINAIEVVLDSRTRLATVTANVDTIFTQRFVVTVQQTAGILG